VGRIGSARWISDRVARLLGQSSTSTGIRRVTSKRAIVVGQRFRDVQPGQFARPALDWIVEAVYTGTDGIEHAMLVCATDLFQRKTFSVSVLLDQRRFERTQQ